MHSSTVWSVGTTRLTRPLAKGKRVGIGGSRVSLSGAAPRSVHSSSPLLRQLGIKFRSRENQLHRQRLSDDPGQPLGAPSPGDRPELDLRLSEHGVLAGDGYIYGVPCDAPSVIQIDCQNDTVNFLGDLGDMPDKYQGGFLNQDDGVVYCIPENAENVLRICPAGSSPVPEPRVGFAIDAS